MSKVIQFPSKFAKKAEPISDPSDLDEVNARVRKSLEKINKLMDELKLLSKGEKPNVHTIKR